MHIILVALDGAVSLLRCRFPSLCRHLSLACFLLCPGVKHNQAQTGVSLQFLRDIKLELHTHLKKAERLTTDDVVNMCVARAVVAC